MHRSLNNSTTHKAGFTLMELLLVLSLLVVLSATAIVGISRFQNSQPLNQAVEMLRVEFARTRTFAIDEGIPWVISRTDEHAFRRGPERNADDRSAKELRLPREVRAASEDTIRFYPDGTVSGTTIILTDHEGVEQALVLDRLTGMLQLQRHHGGRHDS